MGRNKFLFELQVISGLKSQLIQLTLSRNECILLFVAIDKIGVYIISGLVVVDDGEQYSRVIVAKDVRVTIFGLILFQSGHEKQIKITPG